MMYLSLLSMYNKEKAMILDTFVAVYCLRSVVFKLVLRRVPSSPPLSLSSEASWRCPTSRTSKWRAASW